MISRREFFLAGASLAAGVSFPAGRVRFAVITDLHHGLAPDAWDRLNVFVEAVKGRKYLDFVIQMGDFTYSTPDSKPCLDLWRALPQPKLHVLGNHDMDKVDKAGATRALGMRSRYGAAVYGGYRFLWLDLNHFKKGGRLIAYANGNYFTDGATHNWADPEQLAWLRNELERSREPVILFAHQPLGFAETGQPMPPEQVEVLDVIQRSARVNPRGAVRACLFGHLHVDRLETVARVPYLCVNSASYFWSSGMHPYTKPLYAIVEITPDGRMIVEGRSGAFVRKPPAESDGVIGRSASISNWTLPLR